MGYRREVQTLRELVNIESDSRDTEGLEQLAALLGERLAALGSATLTVHGRSAHASVNTFIAGVL